MHWVFILFCYCAYALQFWPLNEPLVGLLIWCAMGAYYADPWRKI